MYSAGLLVGNSIFFVPWFATSIGVLNLGQVPWRVDPWMEDQWVGDTTEKYSASVRVGDLVFFIPLTADNVGVLDVSSAHPTFAELTFGGQLAGTRKFSDGVYVNGYIYLVPFSAGHIGVLDVREPADIAYSVITGTPDIDASPDKWSDGVLVGDGRIFFAPYSTFFAGIYDPSTLQFTKVRIDAIYQAPMNFGGGNLAANGKIYLRPYSLSGLVEFDTLDYTQVHTYGSTGTFFNQNGDWDSSMRGAVLASNGNIYFTPAFGSYTYLPRVPGMCAPGAKPAPVPTLTCEGCPAHSTSTAGSIGIGNCTCWPGYEKTYTLPPADDIFSCTIYPPGT